MAVVLSRANTSVQKNLPSMEHELLMTQTWCAEVSVYFPVIYTSLFLFLILSNIIECPTGSQSRKLQFEDNFHW